MSWRQTLKRDIYTFRSWIAVIVIYHNVVLTDFFPSLKSIWSSGGSMYMGQFDINFTSPCASISLDGVFEELSVLTSLCTSLSVLWFEPCDVDVAVVTTVLFTAWCSSVFFSLHRSLVMGTGFVEVDPFLSRKNILYPNQHGSRC